MRGKGACHRRRIFQSLPEGDGNCRLHLIYNSYGLILAAHEPFESTEAAIEKESDIHSDSIVVKRTLARKTVGDTDIGRGLKAQIRDLNELLAAYRSGLIPEKL